MLCAYNNFQYSPLLDTGNHFKRNLINLCLCSELACLTQFVQVLTLCSDYVYPPMELDSVVLKDLESQFSL